MAFIPPSHRDSRLCEGGALAAFLGSFRCFSGKTGQKTPASLPMVIGGMSPHDYGQSSFSQTEPNFLCNLSRFNIRLVPTPLLVACADEKTCPRQEMDFV
jgi:hypothetical protein